ncbi:MAG TPA: hydrogenase expression/formation C-terminal domain-containing protein [Burkholderiales bacterium]|nr:hydrogenase expression/formation C-terminal domain-containing protein [Burkholderiales bacterium]
MKPFSIPVRTIGPGSQPQEAEPLDILPLPTGMGTFRMPAVPESADRAAMARARDVIASLLERLAAGDGMNGAHPRLDVTRLDDAALDILNQVLGEGEVSIKLQGGRGVRIQESLFAGVWRVQRLDSDGRLHHDEIEVCPIPGLVREVAAGGATGLCAVDLPAGAMNSPALLTEIREWTRRYRPGQPAHVVNLTLLPLSPEDHRVLEQALPVGAVAVMSRGFGNCRITSTTAPHVWRVQYFNNMQTLILNTIEIVDVPEVAIAAADDLADTRERLMELVAWMTEDCES